MFWVSHSYNIPKLSFLKHFYGNKQFLGMTPPHRRWDWWRHPRWSNNHRCFFLRAYLLAGAITILKNMSSSMGRMTSHIWNGKQHVPNSQPYIYIYIYIRAIIDVVCGSCVARHIIHSIIEIWAWPQKPWRKNRFFFNPKEGENRPLTNLDQLGPTYT